MLLAECKFLQSLWKLLWRFLKTKQKAKAGNYNVAPPFLSLSTYLKEIRPIYQRPLHFHACRGISLSNEKWDPFKCPTDDWVKKVWYI